MAGFFCILILPKEPQAFTANHLPGREQTENGKFSVFEISELVTDAPRGKVIKTKIEKYFPLTLKILGFEYILDKLPSFGGNWKQYYEIRMEWKE